MNLYKFVQICRTAINGLILKTNEYEIPII